MLLGTVACLTSAGQLIGLFTDNPETILAGQTALRIISAGFAVSAVSVILGRIGGAWEGNPVPHHLAVPVPVHHYPGSGLLMPGHGACGGSGMRSG